MTTELTPPYLGAKVKMLNTQFEKKLNQRVAEILPGVTGAQVGILQMLFVRPERIFTQKDIEQSFMLSHPTTRGLIKRLIQIDLITTTPLASDQRQVQVMLSEKGQQLMATHITALEQNLQEVDERATKGLTPQEKQQLMQLMDRMIENL